jgi:hypothetical protein
LVGSPEGWPMASRHHGLESWPPHAHRPVRPRRLCPRWRIPSRRHPANRRLGPPTARCRPQASLARLGGRCWGQ